MDARYVFFGRFIRTIRRSDSSNVIVLFLYFKYKVGCFRYLFQNSGYKYVMVTQICTLSLASLLVLVFYRRLVPLRLKPDPGKSAKYNDGVFYTL